MTIGMGQDCGFMLVPDARFIKSVAGCIHAAHLHVRHVVLRGWARPADKNNKTTYDNSRHNPSFLLAANDADTGNSRFRYAGARVAPEALEQTREAGVWLSPDDGDEANSLTAMP